MLQILFQPGMVQPRVAQAVLVVGLFAIAAFSMRAVTRSGALAGAAVSFIIYLGAGPGAFAVLFSVFVLTFVATRIGYGRKRRLGTAEGARGRRASQVFANLGVATGLTGASALFPDSYSPPLIFGAVAALAEAAADTVSSELGQAVSDHAYLVTNFQRVRAGTDGAITLPGTLAAVFSAGVVTAVALLTQLVPATAVAPVTGAAILGTFVDSLLGACLERRGLIGNDIVNFVSTTASAAMAIALAFLNSQ